MEERVDDWPDILLDAHGDLTNADRAAIALIGHLQLGNRMLIELARATGKDPADIVRGIVEEG
jgi:hypothetical protein